MAVKSIKEILKEKYANEKGSMVLEGLEPLTRKGFTLIPNYILKSEELKPYTKLVMACLLSYAWGKKNNAFPGQERLAKDCGISERSVWSALQELENKGFIISHRRGLGKTNLYIILGKRIDDY